MPEIYSYKYRDVPFEVRFDLRDLGWCVDATQAAAVYPQVKGKRLLVCNLPNAAQAVLVGKRIIEDIWQASKPKPPQLPAAPSSPPSWFYRQPTELGALRQALRSFEGKPFTTRQLAEQLSLTPIFTTSITQWLEDEKGFIRVAGTVKATGRPARKYVLTDVGRQWLETPIEYKPVPEQSRARTRVSIWKQAFRKMPDEFTTNDLATELHITRTRAGVILRRFEQVAYVAFLRKSSRDLYFALTDEGRRWTQSDDPLYENPIDRSAIRKGAIAGCIALGIGLVLYGMSKAINTPNVKTSAFGLDALSRAQSDLGVTETSDPTRVAQMLANFGISEQANWCAAAVGTWIHEAANVDNVVPPIAGSAGAKNTMTQFQNTSDSKVGWLDVSVLRQDPSVITPGMIPIWQRGATGSWMGHIGIVNSTDGAGNFTSIEGNAGPTGGAVAKSSHNVSSTALLGMGYFKDTPIFASSPNVASTLSGPPIDDVVVVPTMKLTFSNGASVRAEIAGTGQEQAIGLMNRPYMPEGAGMLFIFDRSAIHSMYMKNTLIPLDMIFMDVWGYVVGIIENATPHDQTLRSVNSPSQYVLEVNGGWAKRHGVAVGMVGGSVEPFGYGALNPDPGPVERAAYSATFTGDVGYVNDPQGVDTFAPILGVQPERYIPVV